MRKYVKTTKRRQIPNGMVFESLEPRMVLDGSGVLSDLPPVPEVDFSRPIDLAFLDAIGENLYILSGDGDAGPWKEQWIEKPETAETNVPAAVLATLVLGDVPIQAARQLGRAPDLSWLDDGSGDCLTDRDIYDFSTPSSAVRSVEHTESEPLGSQLPIQPEAPTAIHSSSAPLFIWASTGSTGAVPAWILDDPGAAGDSVSGLLSASLLLDYSDKQAA